MKSSNMLLISFGMVKAWRSTLCATYACGACHQGRDFVFPADLPGAHRNGPLLDPHSFCQRKLWSRPSMIRAHLPSCSLCSVVVESSAFIPYGLGLPDRTFSTQGISTLTGCPAPWSIRRRCKDGLPPVPPITWKYMGRNDSRRGRARDLHYLVFRGAHSSGKQ